MCNRHYRPIFPSHVQRTLLIVQKLLFSLESNDCLYTLTRSKQQKAKSKKKKCEQKERKKQISAKRLRNHWRSYFQFSMNFCTATRLVRNNTKQLLITLTYTAVAVVVAASSPVKSDFPVNISMIMIDCASTLLHFYFYFPHHSSSRP